MIYIILLVVFIIPVYFYDFAQLDKGKRFWYYFELFILILLAGLRYRVGGDTLDYIDYFDEYPLFSELKNFDFQNSFFNPLWYIYNSIIKSIYDDFIFFQIVQSLIVNIVFFWFFKKYTKYFFSAILIYYFGYYLYFNMEILREILCICLFMVSFQFIEMKKYHYYFVFAIISYFIHFSSLIMFLIPFLFLLPKINWKYAIISFASIITILSFVDIVPFLISLFAGNEKMLIKATAYTSMDGHVLNSNGIIAYTLPLLLLMYVNRNNEISELQIKIEKLLLLYFVLIGISFFVPAMFSRMQNYIEPFYILYIVETFYSTLKAYTINEKLKSYMVKFALLFFLFIIYKSYTVDCSDYMEGTKSYNIYYPYHSVFDPVVEVEREKFVEIYKFSDL